MRSRLAFSSVVALLALSSVASAQRNVERWLRDCENNNWGDDEVICEVREEKLGAPSGAMRVDGRQNGGITVIGWDRNEVLVRAMVQARGRSDSEARELSKEITVDFRGATIRADGPSTSRRRNWSVSYEIYVPRKTDVDLETYNGGITLTNIEGRASVSAHNGGLHFDNVGGDIRGETQNGGVHVTLAGSRWAGDGMDVSTRNGGVTIEIPRSYSARLETGTVNGGMNIDFPITVQGRIGRRITTTLGDGGALLRVMTTNGGVTVGRS